MRNGITTISEKLGTWMSVGVLQVLTGLLSLYVRSQAGAIDSYPFLVIPLALATTHIAYVVSRASDATIRREEKLSSSVRDIVTASETAITRSRITTPFLGHVADLMVCDLKLGIQELVAVKQDHLLSEIGYLHRASHIISNLGEGSTVLAICGDKNWQSQTVRGFHSSNYEAAERGAQVTRIFLTSGDQEVDVARRAVMDEHAHRAKNINHPGFILPLKVELHASRRFIEEHALPAGFGLTLIQPRGGDAEVLIHWGMWHGHGPVGFWLRHKAVTAICRDIFLEIRTASIEHVLQAQ